MGRIRRYSNRIYLFYKIQVRKQLTKKRRSSHAQSKRQAVRELYEGSNPSHPIRADWWLYSRKSWNTNHRQLILAAGQILLLSMAALPWVLCHPRSCKEESDTSQGLGTASEVPLSPQWSRQGRGRHCEMIKRNLWRCWGRKITPASPPLPA